jgi:hypothetical protein
VIVYNVRDVFGHFVRPVSARGGKCPHACCRNRRIHPDNMPVVPESRVMRRASDEQLERHLRKHSDDIRVIIQVGAEIDRREARRKEQARRRTERQAATAERRRTRAEAREANRAANRMEREAIVEHSFIQAENATNGYMVNRLGQARGISERSLFVGPESRARKYASPELLEHWQSHPRPTAAMLAGRDTRVYETYQDDRRTRATVRRRV